MPSSASAQSPPGAAPTAGGAQLSQATYTLEAGGAACTSVMKVAVPAAPPIDLVLEPRWRATDDPETQPYLALDRIVIGRSAH